MTKLFIIVILMALVTYLPRAVPLVYLTNKRLPDFLRNFLRFVPFAALGALIFPSILYSTNYINSAMVGAAAAITCAFFRLNVTIVVFAGIAGAFIYELMIV